MSSLKGYDVFLRRLFQKYSVGFLVIFVSHYVWFLHFSLELGKLLKKMLLFSSFMIIDKTSN